MRSKTGGAVRLATLTMLLTLVSAGSASPILAQTPPLAQQVPVTAWSAEAAVGLTAVGSWLATVNDPVAGPGQAVPDYAYWHEFYFAGTESYGHLSLETFGGGKFASLFISDEEEGRTHLVRAAFPWQAGRFYFPLLYRVGDGIWGGCGSTTMPPRSGRS